MPRVTELRADNDWLGPVLDPLIAAHASIAKQLKVVSASVLDAAREDADVRRMMTVPGIGAMTALAFKAAIDEGRISASVSAEVFGGVVKPLRLVVQLIHLAQPRRAAQVGCIDGIPAGIKITFLR